MRGSPTLSALAVAALALGIGANTAMFSIIHSVLLRPLPYKEPGNLVLVYETHPLWGESGSVFDPDYLEWKRQNQVFETMAAFHLQSANLTGGSEPERVQGAAVSASLFDLLGVSPPVGRVFTDEEETPGRNKVVLLSHSLWRGRFGEDKEVIGRSVALDGEAYTILGVMPAGFEFPNWHDFWVPLTLTSDRSNSWNQVIARLKSGISPVRALEDMSLIARRLQEQHPETNREIGVRIVSLHESQVGNIRPALLVLFGAVIFVLFIACANIAHLLLARALTRQREIAIRLAIGATRYRIVRQLLTESMLVGLLGGAAGVFLAIWGLDASLAFAPPEVVRHRPLALDFQVLAFTLAVSLGTGVLFGLAPALRASRPSMQDALKETGIHGGGGSGRHAGRSVLMAAEVALTFILLVGAGLLFHSFARLTRSDAGYDARNVLAMNVALPESKYRSTSRLKAFHGEVLERLSATPGVLAAGSVSTLPLRMGIRGDFEVEDRPPGDRQFRAYKTIVGLDYFRAMSIPVLRGRYFTERDTEASPPVVIISRDMARRLWPGEDPLTKRLNPGLPGSEWCAVVGVVGEVKQFSLREEFSPGLYLPYQQMSRPFFLQQATLVMRTGSHPLGVAPAARAAVQSVDIDLPVYDLRTMESFVMESVAEPRFNMILTGAFAGLAILLAVVGIYGVVSYSVERRTHEIGIRMALGALPGEVARLVLRQGLWPVLSGLAVGAGGALLLTRFLRNQLYEITPGDPATFGEMSLFLLVVALMALLLPARKAAAVDPMTALRHE